MRNRKKQHRTGKCKNSQGHTNRCCNSELLQSFKDPARAIDLDDLCRVYFGASWHTIRRLVVSSEEVMPADQVNATFEVARRTEPPTVDWRSLSTHEIVRRIASEVQP